MIVGKRPSSASVTMRTVGGNECIGYDVKRVRLVPEGLERRCYILGSPDPDPGCFKTECLGHGLNPICLQHRFGVTGVSQDGQSTKLGNSLAQELEPLADKVGLLDRDSGHVAGGMDQTLNQAPANRIERNGKDNRNIRYCLPEDGNSAAIGDDDVGFASFEFGGDFTDAIGSSGGPAMFYRNGVSLGPAELAQMRDESGGPRPPYGRIRTQYSDEPLLFRLLRVGGQGPSADETASDSLGHSAVNVRNASDADKSNVRASSISGQIARLL